MGLERLCANLQQHPAKAHTRRYFKTLYYIYPTCLDIWKSSEQSSKLKLAWLVWMAGGGNANKKLPAALGEIFWQLMQPALTNSGSCWSLHQKPSKSRTGLSLSNLLASCQSERPCQAWIRLAFLVASCQFAWALNSTMSATPLQSAPLLSAHLLPFQRSLCPSCACWLLPLHRVVFLSLLLFWLANSCQALQYYVLHAHRLPFSPILGLDSGKSPRPTLNACRQQAASETVGGRRASLPVGYLA